MGSQPSASTNLSLCLPCNSPISSAWVAEMRQLMLYLMTYLMAHFPEVMRTYNYLCAQCELWLLCKQKSRPGIQLPHFKQAKIKNKNPLSLRSLSSQQQRQTSIHHNKRHPPTDFLRTLSVTWENGSFPKAQ